MLELPGKRQSKVGRLRPLHKVAPSNQEAADIASHDLKAFSDVVIVL